MASPSRAEQGRHRHEGEHGRGGWPYLTARSWSSTPRRSDLRSAHGEGGREPRHREAANADFSVAGVETHVTRPARTDRSMPWGFRRSMKLAGPLRLNFSKSGLGLSLGVPGLHIGSGPRGRYLRARCPRNRRVLPHLARQTEACAHVRADEDGAGDGMDAGYSGVLSGDPKACLSILDAGPVGAGPAVHIEVDADGCRHVLPTIAGLRAAGPKHSTDSVERVAPRARGRVGETGMPRGRGRGHRAARRAGAACVRMIRLS